MHAGVMIDKKKFQEGFKISPEQIRPFSIEYGSFTFFLWTREKVEDIKTPKIAVKWLQNHTLNLKSDQH